MTTNNITPPTPEEHAKRFRETHEGKGLTDKQIENICSSILGSQKPLAGAECVGYYKLTLASAVFYICVMIEVRKEEETPKPFFKHFIGHCGGLTLPGLAAFSKAVLYPCAPYTYEDIFNKQIAIEVDAETYTGFVRFFDKDSHLLGYMWGVGEGTVLGVMGGKGEWKDGRLS